MVPCWNLVCVRARVLPATVVVRACSNAPLIHAGQEGHHLPRPPSALCRARPRPFRLQQRAAALEQPRGSARQQAAVLGWLRRRRRLAPHRRRRSVLRRLLLLAVALGQPLAPGWGAQGQLLRLALLARRQRRHPPSAQPPRWEGAGASRLGVGVAWALQQRECQRPPLASRRRWGLGSTPALARRSGALGLQPRHHQLRLLEVAGQASVVSRPRLVGGRSLPRSGAWLPRRLPLVVRLPALLLAQPSRPPRPALPVWPGELSVRTCKST